MKSFGLPDEIIVGKVIEIDPPHKLVQTWHPLFDAGTTAEPHTRLTYEIKENQSGLCTVTITHDVTGAPRVAGMVAGGGDPTKGGGGLAMDPQRSEIAARDRRAYVDLNLQSDASAPFIRKATRHFKAREAFIVPNP